MAVNQLHSEFNRLKISIDRMFNEFQARFLADAKRLFEKAFDKKIELPDDFSQSCNKSDESSMVAGFTDSSEEQVFDQMSIALPPVSGVENIGEIVSIEKVCSDVIVDIPVIDNIVDENGTDIENATSKEMEFKRLSDTSHEVGIGSDMIQNGYEVFTVGTNTIRLMKLIMENDRIQSKVTKIYELDLYLVYFQQKIYEIWANFTRSTTERNMKLKSTNWRIWNWTRKKRLLYSSLAVINTGSTTNMKSFNFFGRLLRAFKYYPLLSKIIVVSAISDGSLIAYVEANTYSGSQGHIAHADATAYDGGHALSEVVPKKKKVVLLGTGWVGISENEISMKTRGNGKTICAPYGMVLWSTGIDSRPLIKEFMKQIGQGNRCDLATDEWLRVERINNVYALGDCATMNQRKVMEDIAEIFKKTDKDNSGTLTVKEFDMCERYPQVELYLKNKQKRNIVDFVKEVKGDVATESKEVNIEEFKTALSKVDSQMKNLPTTAQVAKQQVVHVVFVKEIVKQGVPYEDDGKGQKGESTIYFAWKMIVEGKYEDVIRLVIELREYELILVRLLGEGVEDGQGAVENVREWILEHDNAIVIISERKMWLSMRGAYEWSENSPLPLEVWLCHHFLPFHLGRIWCHCLMAYLPMLYLYGKRFVDPITPTILSLRKELYIVPYHETLE